MKVRTSVLIPLLLATMFFSVARMGETKSIEKGLELLIQFWAVAFLGNKLTYENKDDH